MEHTREELKKKREHYRTKMFRLMLEVVFIFGIPAGLAGWAYTYLDGRGVVPFLALSPLFVAFVLSWIITLYRVKVVSKQLKEVEDELKA